MFMAIWLSHISVVGKLFLRNHCPAVAPWLILFDGLAAMRLILVPVLLAIWLCGCSYEIYVWLLCGCRGKAAKILARLPDARAGPEFKTRPKKYYFKRALLLKKTLYLGGTLLEADLCIFVGETTRILQAGEY